MIQLQKVVYFFEKLSIMVLMMDNKGNKLKNFAIGAVEVVWKAAWAVIILPFIVPAFLISKLFGVDPLSMDDMGAGFVIMVLIAIGIAIAGGFFLLGTLI